MAKLTKKQKLFATEYLVDLNATQAAIRAGYSKKTARVIGGENLLKPAIQEAIQEAMLKRQKQAEVDALYVLKKAVSLLEVNLADFIVEGVDGPRIDISNATREQMACIESLQMDTVRRGSGDETEYVDKVKITLPSKLKALEILGKHIDIAAFAEQHKHNHSGNIDHTHTHTAKESIDFDAIRDKRKTIEIEGEKNVH